MKSEIGYVLKVFLIMVPIVISFSLGITAYMWNQPALAILFTIITPVASLYVLISSRYKKTNKKKSNKKKKDPVDNYFHPVEKEYKEIR